MVNRELMLVKVKCLPTQRGELRDLADIFHGTVCDVSLTTMTIELTGKKDKMGAFQALLEPYGGCWEWGFVCVWGSVCVWGMCHWDWCVCVCEYLVLHVCMRMGTRALHECAFNTLT